MQVRVPWTQAWLCTKDFCRKCTGAGVAAKVAVPSNAAQRGDREGAQKDEEPPEKQAAPAEVPEQALQRGVKLCSSEVAQRSPTPPEDNLESRAIQVRVPWTQAWLCTKDFRRKCTEA
ncbi:hypothetical protein NDU88_004146 [Pleurodeles waltl]|uniref:Uncharacterized protein n=1 Tax=Pleurodeles waltl TaxID=8319 RepID=A0AAV7TRR9_PLEWA|nr:hypothetical protein NDU88_004146 [Pleurodeles waltl]